MSCYCSAQPCPSLTVRVVSIDTTANPVTLTINRSLTELAQNHCFRLLMMPCSCSDVNTNPVSIVDSAGTDAPVILRNSGNVLRYDSLVDYVNRGNWCCDVAFDCFFGNDGMPDSELHVVFYNCLPPSSYVVTAAAPAE